MERLVRGRRRGVGAWRQGAESRGDGGDGLFRVDIAIHLNLDRPRGEARRPQRLEPVQRQRVAVRGAGGREPAVAIAQHPVEIALNGLGCRTWHRRVACFHGREDALERRFVPARKSELGREQAQLVAIILRPGHSVESEGVLIDPEVERQAPAIHQLKQVALVEIADATGSQRIRRGPQGIVLARREALPAMAEPDGHAHAAGLRLVAEYQQLHAVGESDLFDAEHADGRARENLARRGQGRERSHRHGLVAQPGIGGGLDRRAEGGVQARQRIGLWCLEAEQGALRAGGEEPPGRCEQLLGRHIFAG